MKTIGLISLILAALLLGHIRAEETTQNQTIASDSITNAPSETTAIAIISATTSPRGTPQMENMQPSLINRMMTGAGPGRNTAFVVINGVQFAINCEPFCLRRANGNFVTNCNQPVITRVCAFCRISFRCGINKQVFSG